ncbi:MAG: aldolase/citrate lyase family protein [Atribacterota bacterium]|nr:aldolase/citrate lyase family protein [Atribacterota bacterium]
MEGALGFRKKLATGKVCLGTWVSFTDPTVTELLSGAGFDFLVLDMEHAPLTIETIQLHLLALEEGVAGIVRVPHNDPVLVKQVLDVGAQGVMIPMVTTREEAERAVASCFYPPRGIRGFGPRRASFYDRLGEIYLQKARDVLVMIQIEHIESVNRIDEILGVKGIGAIFIGPWDLSGSLGVLGEINHPQVIASINHVIAKTKEKNIPVGIATPLSEEEAWRWMEREVQFLTVGTDYGFLARSADVLVDRLRAKCSR